MSSNVIIVNLFDVMTKEEIIHFVVEMYYYYTIDNSTSYNSDHYNYNYNTVK